DYAPGRWSFLFRWSTLQRVAPQDDARQSKKKRKRYTVTLRKCFYSNYLPKKTAGFFLYISFVMAVHWQWLSAVERIWQVK
uniref:Uncharacterized protein n=1 Tax=Anopheles minimus TaxID=112268 RepID=A0A182WPZ5_9DIPT